MQDLLQLSLEDEEVAELFEGVTAGSKVKITLEVTVSEIDDERFVATVDMVEDEVDVIGGGEVEDEEDYESEDEDDEEEYEYEEDEEDEDE
jgi:hypothetical protein